MEECRICVEPCRDCGFDPHDPICTVCGEIHPSPMLATRAAFGELRVDRLLREHDLVVTTVCDRCGRRYARHLSRAAGMPNRRYTARSGMTGRPTTEKTVMGPPMEPPGGKKPTPDATPTP